MLSPRRWQATKRGGSEPPGSDLAVRVDPNVLKQADRERALDGVIDVDIVRRSLLPATRAGPKRWSTLSNLPTCHLFGRAKAGSHLLPATRAGEEAPLLRALRLETS